MLQIEISRLNKFYGAYHALRDITLEIPKGQFVALVGPSGCGKSTLLRTIAGLETVSSGTLRIAGKDVGNLPPRSRDVAMVFQSYALYPHMTVEANMNYALKLRRLLVDEIKHRTKSAAQTLGLDALMNRMPRQLSGGQRQRVAMGRAIVRQPAAFLFDEPLSNLDAALRVHMRNEIRALHRRLDATSIYVTHDQIEAMTMADHIVVLRQGVIEQQGRPMDLYDRPANIFVAGFIGSPSMNFLKGHVSSNGETLHFDGTTATIALPRPLAPGQLVVAGIRPEHLSFMPIAGASKLELTIADVECTGSLSFIYADCGGTPVITTSTDRTPFARGAQATVWLPHDKLHLFDPASTAALV